jgi:hypothetical protein
MKPEGQVCQSCGMPLARDAKGGGTNADGSKSDRYCSHCYQDGKFTLPDLSVADMQARVLTRLKGIGMPEGAAHGLVQGIPDLERWSGTRD